MPTSSPQVIEPERTAVDVALKHLEKIEFSETFNGVEHQRRLVRFLVEQRIAGRLDPITQSEIVFAKLLAASSTKLKPELLFPDEQAVRTHMSRLRKSLLAYYKHEAPSAAFQIEIPKGRYVALFSRVGPEHSPPNVGELRSVNVKPILDLPRVWNIPPHNPLFTGRAALLEAVHQSLAHNGRAALTQPKALSGLGGIGKTQTAIEYAWRYRDQYETALWCGADSRETLFSDFAALAQTLDLPPSQQPGLSVIVDNVRGWFEAHSRWLLILDNVEDLAVARPFASAFGQGHVLITTRLHATGEIADLVELPKMEIEESILFLLRRAKIIGRDQPAEATTEENRRLAKKISEEVDGLPLALDQAGAYIEEIPSTLAKYLELYRTAGRRLRARRGGFGTDHVPVTKTFSLSSSAIAKINPAAVDLLKVCAFLAPEGIPEELFTKASQELGEVLGSKCTDEYAWEEVVEDAGKFSLVYRNPDNRTFSIHRVVQAVLKDDMDNEGQRLWAQRVVNALNVAYSAPGATDRLLPHITAVAQLIQDFDFHSPSAAALLNKAGINMCERAQYAEAEPLLKRALAIQEQTLGPDDPDTAETLSNLAGLYDRQGRYREAEPLYVRALVISERVLGPDHPTTGTRCNNLACLYIREHRYQDAEPLFRRSLEIDERTLGGDHPRMSVRLNNLAMLYERQGRFEEAEPLYVRALAISEKILGPDHPDTSNVRNNYADLVRTRKKLSPSPS